MTKHCKKHQPIRIRLETTYQFLRQLAAHNDREWFAANRPMYLEAKDEVERLTTRIITSLTQIDPRAARLQPSDCLYRIYRDTRFSPDKTPYKTHIGVFINPPKGKKSLTAGYYLHFEPDNSFISGGTVCLPSPIIKRIRQDVYDNIEEYIGIVESPEFRKFFTSVGENPLKTAPKGFPKDWPHIAYLRPRDFCVTHHVADTFMMRKDLPEKALPIFRQIQRFNDFINYSIAPPDSD